MPRRKRSTWGSVRHLGGNRWELRFMADMRDGRGYRQVSCTVRGTRSDADGELARLRLLHSADAPCPTLGQCYEAWWLPDMRKRLSDGKLAPRTYGCYTRSWERDIAPVWASVPISGIRPLDVQSWLGRLPEQAGTVALVLCRGCIDKAMLYEACDANVFRRKYVLGVSGGRGRDKSIYSLADAVRMAAELEGTRAWAAFVLAAIAGCRPGEAKGAACSRVAPCADPATGMVLALVEICDETDDDGHMLGRIKNGYSARPAVVPEPWSIGILDLARSGRAFLSDRGDDRPLTGWLAKKDMGAAARALGLPYVTMQNLRPTWRTWAVDAGYQPEMMEKMMGHVGDGTSMRHYYRPGPGSFVSKVAEVFGDPVFRSTYGILWDEKYITAGRLRYSK